MRRLLCLLAGFSVLGRARADVGPFTMDFEELAPGVWAGVPAAPEKAKKLLS